MMSGASAMSEGAGKLSRANCAPSAYMLTKVMNETFHAARQTVTVKNGH